MDREFTCITCREPTKLPSYWDPRRFTSEQSLILRECQECWRLAWGYYDRRDS